jgi:hypothetical protein
MTDTLLDKRENTKVFQDYDTLLGLSKDASQKEIQRACRKLALKYHPNVNKGELDFEMFFTFWANLLNPFSSLSRACGNVVQRHP